MPEAPQIAYDVYVRDGTKTAVTGTSLVGIQVTACAPDDAASCSDPISTGSSDEDDHPVVLELPMGDSGFEGPLQLEHPDWHPGLQYLGHPVTRPEGRLTIGVLPPLDDAIQAMLGVDLDPDRGHVVIQVFDCLGDHAPDVHFEISGADASTVPFYMQGTWFPETHRDRTQTDGTGGFFNLAPGWHDITARIVDGPVVSTLRVYVRAVWMTQVWLYPSPAPPG